MIEGPDHLQTMYLKSTFWNNFNISNQIQMRIIRLFEKKNFSQKWVTHLQSLTNERWSPTVWWVAFDAAKPRRRSKVHHKNSVRNSVLREIFVSWNLCHICTYIQIDWSPAFLTSDNFIRSKENIRTKWPIYVAICHFVLTI